MEFPETRCYGRLLAVELSATHAPPGMALAEGATHFRVVVNEEDARRPGELSFAQGTVWTVGMAIETRVRSPTTGALGPWVSGRLIKFGKCGAKMPEATPWSERAVDCFVLLLTRDGSHGLDLSMLTHLYLADQIWDPSVEQQVIARAFRMGATGPCTVSQLLMRGTLEETLHHMVVAGAGGGGGGTAGGGGRAASEGGSEDSAGGATAGSQMAVDVCAECTSSSDAGSGGAERDLAAHSPEAAGASARATGKRRLGDEGPSNDDRTPPGKRRVRWEDGQDRERAVRQKEAAAPQPKPPKPPEQPSTKARDQSAPMNSASALEAAKVHSLLKAIKFLRC